MSILVSGAAGYIGSIVTEELVKQGDSVIAIDNLKQGHRQAIPPQPTFIQLDIGDLDGLERLFRRYRIEAVMHLAAETIVEQSVADPARYFQSNVVYSVNLLQTMLKHDVHKIVFSSTAAVYGEPERVPIRENAPKNPVNPYGETKLMVEKILHWYGRAYGLKSISLRYFNAAGASEQFGEDHEPETHLVPNILKVALGQRPHLLLFGTDYDTRDGSCIRDYIHVLDIARAHLLALQQLDKSEGDKAYNLGNGEGYSVIEVIETARKVTRAPIPVVVQPRRPGDPPVLVADSQLAKEELGWQPEYPELEAIIESAWRWQRSHPYGYRS